MRHTPVPSLLLFAAAQCLPAEVAAQGWPSQYDGVMLQGFYWNSYGDSQWSYHEQHSDELSKYFSLIWV